MGDGCSKNKSRCHKLKTQQKELLENIRALLKAPITYRELECSRFLMLGYSASSIAKMLSISTRTVEYYIHNLRLKCNCDSKWQLSRHLRDKLDLKTPDFENVLSKDDQSLDS